MFKVVCLCGCSVVKMHAKHGNEKIVISYDVQVRRLGSTGPWAWAHTDFSLVTRLFEPPHCVRLSSGLTLKSLAPISDGIPSPVLCLCLLDH